jgi:hypothetical protein
LPFVVLAAITAIGMGMRGRSRRAGAGAGGAQERILRRGGARTLRSSRRSRGRRRGHGRNRASRGDRDRAARLLELSGHASTTIEPPRYGVPQSAYDDAAVAIASRAHARGLAFELLPIVRLERLAPGAWRGTLNPPDWNAWWTSYRNFILHQAAVAERAGAEIFCVGSELGTTEGQRDRGSS